MNATGATKATNTRKTQAKHTHTHTHTHTHEKKVHAGRLCNTFGARMAHVSTRLIPRHVAGFAAL